MNMKFISKYRLMILIYVLYIIFLVARCMTFTGYGMNIYDYLNNFQDELYFVGYLVPIYLMVISAFLCDDNIYHNYRYESRIYWKKRLNFRIMFHTCIFTTIDLLITIVLFGSKYNLDISVQYFLLFAVRLLGFMIVGNTVILLRQLLKDNSVSFLITFIIYSLECLLLYNNILPQDIPLILSWVFVNKGYFYKIVVLLLMNNLILKIAHNLSLKRDFM